MPGTVDHGVDTAPALHRRVHQAVQIFSAQVGAGDAQAAQLLGQGGATAGRREDGHLPAIGGQLTRSGFAQAAARGGEHGNA